ncbi:MAG: 3-methyl-2-oxobutanoate hydroxymethyltransferase [Candidatus Omnitrophica bacterium]|nr:3-methyl-2-oxobutanoate hydroxymethyltransferase [Candidatus Omnitrophota bacterium]MDE2010161.1 3-methyl-2-oxobutanoate hydroxymethyltransferase [Candidatus Omnitrophota bacterium]MDE2214895.1 3-methyl-2-oxobutanoate hydroxymethyltransferase [Candidatus Omnitrophota bacterium]MDE2230775.1 3-methyl-2-oxobutanoate hydroxymethyltransferase [Candidatus Omnitrophota bacterium]
MKNVADIVAQKSKGRRITVLTAYDYPIASFLDEAGIDIILVGDSLANVVLGLKSTTEVGMKEMLYHTGAVARAAKNSFVVADMPFEAYQLEGRLAVGNAQQLMEAGAKAVKIEWFEDCADVASAIVRAGIPVMGHVGLTPQTAQDMKVKAKDAPSARAVIDQALALEESGCFSVVLECIPQEVAEVITRQLKVPTIGIGAGPHCDGQVLVVHDLLGLFSRYQPKFSKKYADLGPRILEAVRTYKKEVTEGVFPDDAHSFHLPPDEIKKLRSLIE